MIISLQGTVTAASNSLTYTFTPPDDLADKVCRLQVHQASMKSTTPPIAETYAAIRLLSFSQPRSVKLQTGSMNDLVYILHHAYPSEGPPLAVYVSPGEQQITFTVENLGAESYTLLLLLSLV